MFLELCLRLQEMIGHVCMEGRIDADAIIYEGWLIRFDVSEGRNNRSFYNCRLLTGLLFFGTGEDYQNIHPVYYGIKTCSGLGD